ncbi:MAG: endonuclease/exonuclease/phosphatase family protein [Anaerolineales bacterium]
MGASIPTRIARLFSPTTPITSICQIQGNGDTTPYESQFVRTEGVVVVDFDDESEKGFFIQDENCDGDPNTSDGIFIYTGQKTDIVSPGDWVEVEGTAQEFFGLTEISAIPAGVTVTSSGNPLPNPVDLSPPFDNDQSQNYFEANEGMYVKLDDARVVGPTDARGDTFVVRADLGISRVFRDDAAGTGEVVPVGEGGPFKIAPDAAVGDQVLGLLGVLDYSFGAYHLQLLAPPTLLSGGTGLYRSPAPTKAPATSVMQQPSSPFPFRIATLNLHNLFDTADDPNTQDTVLSGGDYQKKLTKLALTIHDELGEPVLVAVQEAENDAVLQALVNRLEADYGFLWEDGPDVRGIDLALLYQTGRVTVFSYETRQGCTTLIDGLGPDGNLDVQNPSNAVTCDTDGDGVNDGNRLFSRPPLLAQVQVCETACGSGNVRDLWLIAVHLKSKSQDTDDSEYTLPRRLEQAQFLADLYQELVNAGPDAEVIVLGDFNDYFSSSPLAALTGAGLANLLSFVPHDERYTFIYRGVSQTLDHVLVSQALLAAPGEGLFPGIMHVNADYPASLEGDDAIPTRASDHDPVVVDFVVLTEAIYLPVVVGD